MSTVSTLHERSCEVDGCTEPHRSKGFCNAHYQRHLKGLAMDARRTISRDGPCLIEGCDEPRRSRGLCRSHYDKAIRQAECPVCGGARKKRSVLCVTCFRTAAADQLLTEKPCRGCGRVLPMDAFGLRKASHGGMKWRSRCRECETADLRVRAQRRYAGTLGIPWADVVERYPDDNRCEICGRTPQEANPGGRFMRLALDHCHETGALRGFLCGPCNTGLGHLGDTPERMRAAMRYMVRHYSASACKPSRRRSVLSPDVIPLFELPAAS